MTSEPSVLLIDDSAQDAELIELAFGRSGIRHRFRWVQGVDEAIAYFSDPANPAPPLVLLDIQMPKRDGFEFLKWAREQAGDARLIPVVMLTTSHDFVEIHRAYEQGANSFLVKPTGFEELCGVVKDAGGYWLGLNHPPV